MDVPTRMDEATASGLAALLADQKPSRSWLWAPLLVVGLSFVATGVVLLVEHIRYRPVPEFASVEVIETRYAPQLVRLRELIVSYLDRGYGSEFFEETNLFSGEEIKQAAVHTGPDRITIVGQRTVSDSPFESPPRHDAKVGSPVVYLSPDGRSAVYRAKVVNADGDEGWYSLTLDLEKLKALVGAEHEPTRGRQEADSQ